MLPIKKIVIVGGGTAGWMAASHFAKRWVKKGVEIEVVDSSRIATVGVGEGATPTIKRFLSDIDVQEEEWMPQCNATYKNGIRFVDWSTQAGFKSYFHPFYSEGSDRKIMSDFIQSTRLRREGYLIPDHPDLFSTMAYLTNNNQIPVSLSQPNEFAYSYHFDSTLLANFLKKKSLSFGVKHRDAVIVDTCLSDAGDISAVLLESGERIDADFFVDCSGFRSLLMEGALGVEHQSFSDYLLNDAAIALPSSIDDDIPPLTVSTALKNGWAWKIPLTNRYGNGYVYSSSHVSADQAEFELRQHLGLLDANAESKHLKMKLGHLKKPWYKNCVAFGLSQGFIEPLEATALHFVGKSIIDFIESFEPGGFTNKWQDIYNQRILDDFSHIRDYILFHYRTNTRSDTEYWVDAREVGKNNASLEGLLYAWFGCDDLGEEVERQNVGRHFSSASWHCMLAGVGLYPPVNKPQSACPVDVSARVAQFQKEALAFSKHCLTHGKKLKA